MAVTEQSYTGNGSTTNYSFTFPYLKSTDIQVQVDAAVTTAWSLANATTVQFNSAPANGAAIKILRNTAVDNLTATFYAGSAIKSEDLNDNFTQNLYVTQEVGNRYFANTGGNMTGNLTMGEDADIVFEGATDNAYETTLTVTDPTADRTITLPNVTGTVLTTGSTDAVTSTMLADNAVTNAKMADDAITAAEIAANAVGASELADNAVDTAAIAADAVTGAKIADDSINSEHYVDGSIDTAHLADGQVTSAKIADGTIVAGDLASDAVTTAKITDANVTTAKIANDAVTVDKIADNAIASAMYIDGSIDTAHIADSQITLAKMADSSVGTSELVNDSVTTVKIDDGAVTTAKIAADAVDGTKIADDSIGAEHIAANAVGTSEISDAELVTLAGMQSGTASVLASSTALTSTTTELNLLDGKSFSTSISGSSTDVQIPSAKAVNDQILAVTNAIGGFVAIADEVSFPNANPDPSDGAGTVVSIGDAGGVVVNGSGVATISNGTVGNSTVTVNGFPSSLYSKTLAAGVGLQVQTTSTLNTYTYHKILAKEADVEQLSGDINDFNERYRIASSAPSSDNDEGDLWYDTSADKMKVYDGSAWGDVASTGSFYIGTLSSYSGTGGNSASFNGSAYRFVLSNTPTTSQQLIVSINGVIQKPNAGSSQPSEGFAVDGSSILFSNAPATGSDSFIILIGASVSVGTPSNNTVTEAILQSNVVSEEKLKVSNSPTNGYYLSAQSGASGGLTWAAVSQYSTPLTTRGDILFRDASGDQRLAKGTSGQYLKIGANDPEWADVVGAVADNCIYENDQTISNNYTIASGKGAHSVGPLTVNATVTVNGVWVIS